jgi:hypothetical protein
MPTSDLQQIDLLPGTRIEMKLVVERMSDGTVGIWAHSAANNCSFGVGHCKNLDTAQELFANHFRLRRMSLLFRTPSTSSHQEWCPDGGKQPD